MKIGFFDSGFGGLSVLNEALHRFSGCEFFYYADIKNVPYGVKSTDEITDLSIKACDFLVKKGVKTIVVACNTATSAAINELRSRFDIHIIGMEPAVKIALKHYKPKTLLIATNATINGKKLLNLIENLKAQDSVDRLALPKLVCFAENLEFDSIRVRDYLLYELNKFKLSDYGSLVLGCTHFNYFKDTLDKILPKDIAFVDGIDGTLKRMCDLNNEIKMGGKENIVRYFFSAQKSSDIERIEIFLKRLEIVKEIRSQIKL